jgi:hypothetical protein
MSTPDLARKFKREQSIATNLAAAKSSHPDGTIFQPNSHPPAAVSP